MQPFAKRGAIFVSKELYPTSSEGSQRYEGSVSIMPGLHPGTAGRDVYVSAGGELSARAEPSGALEPPLSGMRERLRMEMRVRSGWGKEHRLRRVRSKTVRHGMTRQMTAMPSHQNHAGIETPAFFFAYFFPRNAATEAKASSGAASHRMSSSFLNHVIWRLA